VAVSVHDETALCVETLEDALARHAKPKIFNTDQGSQFTGAPLTGMPLKNGIAIIMGARAPNGHNVFVDRCCPSVKCEEVYLRAYDTASKARASIEPLRLLYPKAETVIDALFTTSSSLWVPQGSYGAGGFYLKIV
jgi:hypothetical protein